MEHILTMEQITQFRAALRRMERSAATTEKYSRDVTAFYRWLPEGKSVDKQRVLDYKAHLCGRYAPASVNSMLAALRSFFRWAQWPECQVKPEHQDSGEPQP